MPRKPTDDERVRALADELTEEAAHEAAADAALTPSKAAHDQAERWRARLVPGPPDDEITAELAFGSTDGQPSSAGIPVAWLAQQARIDEREHRPEGDGDVVPGHEANDGDTRPDEL